MLHRISLITVLLACCISSGLHAQQKAIDSLHVLVEQEHDSLKAHHLLEIAVLTSKVNLNESIKPFEDAIELAQKLENKKLEAQINYQLAGIYWWIGERHQAMKLDNQTLRIYEELQDTSGIGRTLIGIGVSYQSFGMKDLALEHLTEALKFGKLSGDVGLQIKACQNMSVVLWSLGKEELSLSYIEKGLILIDGNILYEENKANLLLSKASHLFDQGEYDKAFENLLVAQEIYVELNLPSKSLVCTSIILHIEQKRGDATPELILKRYSDLCDESATYGDYPNLLNSLNRWSSYLIKINRFEEAEVLVDSMYRVSKRIDYPKLYLQSLLLKDSLYKVTGRFDKSAIVLKEYIAFNDSLNEVVNEENFNAMMSFLEIDRKNSEIAQLKQKVNDDATIDAQKTLILGLLIFIIAVLLIVAFAFYRNMKTIRLQDERLVLDNKKINEANIKLKKKRNLLNELNESLKDEKEIALAATYSKANFLSNMSHELRTPLNGILGICSLIEQSDMNKDDLSENLDILKFSANNLQSLINDILDYSKLEANKIELVEESDDIEEYLNEVFQTSKILANAKGIEFNCSTDKNIPQYLIFDKTRLNQVMNNLVSNALKFTNKGSLSISVEKVKIGHEIVSLKFSVVDTGIGISKENQKEIFERFNQAELSTSKDYGGTGLGLSISSSLLELMDSELLLESEFGKGANFYFSLNLKIDKSK